MQQKAGMTRKEYLAVHFQKFPLMLLQHIMRPLHFQFCLWAGTCSYCVTLTKVPCMNGTEAQIIFPKGKLSSLNDCIAYIGRVNTNNVALF